MDHSIYISSKIASDKYQLRVIISNMNVSQLFFVIILTGIVQNGNCAKILGIFQVPSKSHHILGSRLLQALAEKGHQVTMISPFPFKHKVKNYRDIFLEEMVTFKENHFQKVFTHNVSFFEAMMVSGQLFRNISEIFLSNREVQGLKAEKFDLVIQCALNSNSFLGLSHYFQAPVIYFSTMGSFYTLDEIVGNTAPPSYVSSVITVSADEVTFLQRVLNSLSSWFYYGVFSYFVEKQDQELLTKYFPEAPPLRELYDNVALVFLNSHYSIESPRPYVPNMIQIGGFHVEEPRELPSDLKSFLDGATEGAVFFSLGSNVKIGTLPKEAVDAILSVLGKLEMKVLFKSEEDLPNLPTNIKLGKWLPQNDILAHPNVKLFVSHGGLLSTIEAVYHGVPILGIPIFGDQLSNIAVAEATGYAAKVEIAGLTEESFSNSINEILTNPKYRDNIKLKSSLMRDQPIRPLDKAIFWVEHVLKYKGAAHLRNAGTKLALYQYLLVDVIVFVLCIVSVVMFVLYFILKKLCSCAKNSVKKKCE